MIDWQSEIHNNRNLKKVAELKIAENKRIGDKLKVDHQQEMVPFTDAMVSLGVPPVSIGFVTYRNEERVDSRNIVQTCEYTEVGVGWLLKPTSFTDSGYERLDFILTGGGLIANEVPFSISSIDPSNSPESHLYLARELSVRNFRLCQNKSTGKPLETPLKFVGFPEIHYSFGALSRSRSADEYIRYDWRMDRLLFDLRQRLRIADEQGF